MILRINFKSWAFNLRNEEFLPCLTMMSRYCEKISYDTYKPNNRGRQCIRVHCLFKEDIHWNDLVDEICYFACDINPRIEYYELPLKPLPLAHVETPVEPESASLVFWFSMLCAWYSIAATIILLLVSHES